MDAQDTILEDIPRKKQIWHGHFERIDLMQLGILGSTENLREGKKNEVVFEEPGKMQYIQQ
jgi:hypothetical protein